MYKENIFYYFGLAVILIYSYYKLSTIIKLIYYSSMAKRKEEDLHYNYNGSFGYIISELFGSLIQILLILMAFQKESISNTNQNDAEIQQATLFSLFYIVASLAVALRIIHAVTSLLLPLVITEKFYFIKGKKYKSYKMKHSFANDQLILAIDRPYGKTEELIRISQNETKIIQVIRKYSSFTSMQNITIDD